MAAPSMNDYEFVWRNSYRFNSAKAVPPFFDVEEFEGFDTPAFNSREELVDGAHGGFVTANTVGVRNLNLVGTLYAPAGNVMKELRKLKHWMSPRTKDDPLWFKMPDLDPVFFMCRPSACEFILDKYVGASYARVRCSFKAGDPRMYSEAQITGNLYDNQTVTFTNEGNLGYSPYITVNGKYEKLVVTVNGVALRFGYTATSATDVTVFDFSKRLVTVNGAVMTGRLENNSWGTFKTSTNAVHVVAVKGSITSYEINARSAWL